MQTAILAAIGSGTCSTVTDTQIASVTNLYVVGYSSSSVVAADFAGLTGLTSLRFDSSPMLTTVPDNAFSNVAATLERIDLRGRLSEHNGITSLGVDAFNGLRALEHIDLGFNTLTTLDADIFDGLTALEILDLQGNGLTTLDADIFDGLTALESLHLSRNSLTTLNADIFDGLTALKTLNLFANSLTALDADIFDGLTALEFLELSLNGLTTLDADIFDGLTALENLLLGSNSLTTLDADIFDGLTALENLGLGSNSLTTLDAHIFDGLDDLATLNLGGNSLTTLDADIFDGLTALDSLALSQNSLTTLDEDIFDGLTILDRLFLNDNSFTTLDEDIFDGLTALESLSLSENSLTTLDEDIFDGLTALESLSLRSNSLTTLDADIFDGLTALEDLGLGSNSLTTLDADIFDGLTALEDLGLGSNILTTLDAGIFDGLTRLKSLSLRCNLLTELDLDIFDPFAATLTSLDIAGNPYTTPLSRADLEAKFPNIISLTFGRWTCRRVMLSPTSLTVAEGSSDSYMVALLTQPTGNVMVAISSDNTEVTVSPTTPLTFTDTNWATAQMVTVSAAQDTDTADDSVTLTHDPSGADYDGVINTALAVTVEDDDDAAETVSFEQAAYSVAEGDDITVTVTLSADPERTVTIPITATNQSGATDADYSGVPANVTFNSGDTSKTFSFTAVDDTEDDDGESVQLGFGTLPPLVGEGGTATSTVSITDDDEPAVTVSFDEAAYSVAEAAGVVVRVTLSADPERTVTIPITATNQGGATSADYNGVPANVTFNSGDTSQTFFFFAYQDTVDDGGESVLLGFGMLPSRVTEGGTANSTVSITDPDPAVTVSFGQAAYSVAEGDDVTVTVTLSADPERTVTIPVTATNQGGATSADYTGVPANVTFNSGDTSKTFTFTATQDAVDDDDESVLLGFGTLPARVSEGTPDETTVSITDDDDPAVTVSFGAASYTAAEGGSVTVTVQLNADPERSVSIPITKSNQGGASNGDYSGVPANVTFNSGDTSETFTFAAVDDTVDDDGESVRLGFGTLPARVSAGTPEETTVSITDDDVPAVTVSFGSATYSAVEGGSATVTVTLSEDPERSVTIPITKSNQGGASNGDYSGVPSSVAFGATERSKTFTFTATQDTVDDDDESVLLGFGTLPARVSEGTPDETTVSITDDDDPRGDGELRRGLLHCGGGGQRHGDGPAER